MAKTNQELKKILNEEMEKTKIMDERDKLLEEIKEEKKKRSPWHKFWKKMRENAI